MDAVVDACDRREWQQEVESKAPRVRQRPKQRRREVRQASCKEEEEEEEEGEEEQKKGAAHHSKGEGSAGGEVEDQELSGRMLELALSLKENARLQSRLLAQDAQVSFSLSLFSSLRPSATRSLCAIVYAYGLTVHIMMNSPYVARSSRVPHVWAARLPTSLIQRVDAAQRVETLASVTEGNLSRLSRLNSQALARLASSWSFACSVWLLLLLVFAAFLWTLFFIRFVPPRAGPRT
jgi:hypothetical protein